MNQEQLEALAEQNRLLREALEGAVEYTALLDDFTQQALQQALALPDLSTSILNQRDARTIRDVAEKIKEADPMLWDLYYRSLCKMAAEKEKSSK